MSAPAAPPSNSAPPSAGDDRDTMIHAMVQRLADRMKTNSDDVDGWQRLAHAYNVLGERDKARQAIDHAVRLKPDDVGVQLILAEIQKSAAAPVTASVSADFPPPTRQAQKQGSFTGSSPA